MTVLDDLRKAQKEFQEPVDELCSKWKSVMPDDLAEADKVQYLSQIRKGGDIKIDKA